MRFEQQTKLSRSFANFKRPSSSEDTRACAFFSWRRSSRAKSARGGQGAKDINLALYVVRFMRIQLFDHWRQLVHLDFPIPSIFVLNQLLRYWVLFVIKIQNPDHLLWDNANKQILSIIRLLKGHNQFHWLIILHSELSFFFIIYRNSWNVFIYELYKFFPGKFNDLILNHFTT